MKKIKILHAIIARLHYIPLAIFAICSNLVSDALIFRILLIASFVYVVAYELYTAIAKRDARSLSESFIEILDFNSQERLMAFPLPVVLADRNGEVIWYNDPFIKVTDGADLSKFVSVFDLNRDIFSKRTLKVSFASKYFTVITDKCTIRGRELAVLYFFDITDYQQLQIKYNQQRPVIAHILVDNYDELFQISKESEKSTAMAVIDNALTEWAQSVGGIIRKTEKDSYLFIFRNEYIKQFTESRFDILDRIRNLQIATSTQPTISIGVGFGGATFAENEEHARLALDMALSRGGDQAEAGFHAGRGIQKNIVKFPPGPVQQPCKGLGIDVLRAAVHGGGEEGQAGVDAMAGGIFQIVAEFGNIQERQIAAVGHAQGDIQIPQAHVAVHAEHLFSRFGQGSCNPGTDGGFSRPALTGHNGIQFAQTDRSLP